MTKSIIRTKTTSQRGSKVETIVVPPILKTLPSNYDLSWTWTYLDQTGRQLFGEKFRLYETDLEVNVKLIAWFAADEKLAKHFGLDLNKELLLTGPVGCGKTTLLQLYRVLQQPSMRPKLIPCRTISFETLKHGVEILPRYTTGPWIYDDLGLENQVQYFGTVLEPMVEVLLTRYENRQFRHSHITTNLSSQEIEDRYGVRIRSRLREMVNLVAFERDAPDKRRV